MTVSVMLGLGAVYLGIVIAREIGLKFAGKRAKTDGIIENESDVN
jgi:hypothetical protein